MDVFGNVRIIATDPNYYFISHVSDETGLVAVAAAGTAGGEDEDGGSADIALVSDDTLVVDSLSRQVVAAVDSVADVLTAARHAGLLGVCGDMLSTVILKTDTMRKVWCARLLHRISCMVRSSFAPHFVHGALVYFVCEDYINDGIPQLQFGLKCSNLLSHPFVLFHGISTALTKNSGH
jgi:hypothetical protein